MVITLRGFHYLSPFKWCRYIPLSEKPYKGVKTKWHVTKFDKSPLLKRMAISGYVKWRQARIITQKKLLSINCIPGTVFGPWNIPGHKIKTSISALVELPSRIRAVYHLTFKGSSWDVLKVSFQVSAFWWLNFEVKSPVMEVYWHYMGDDEKAIWQLPLVGTWLGNIELNFSPWVTLSHMPGTLVLESSN